MVTLAKRIVRQVTSPTGDDPALDRLSLAKWQADRGLATDAEGSLLAALAGDLPHEVYQIALGRLAQLYRQAGRREDAVPIWQQMASTSYDGVEAHIELAKHYEWHAGDLTLALRWTEEALALLDRQRYTAISKQARAEAQHRQARLLRKLSAGPSHPVE
jgi:tetratricopeptide (TPR) repeat protein